MTWIHYFIIYWIICFLIPIFIRIYNTKIRRNRHLIFPHTPEKVTWKQWLILFLVAPFLIFVLLIKPFVTLHNKLSEKRKKKMKDEEEKKLKASIGLKENERYLCFSKMSGVGIIKCDDCGYKKEIISFIHGVNSCAIGRQCPNCHEFFTESNESQKYHTFGKPESDLVCPKCHTVVRTKESSLLQDRNAPLFCPNCHSARLRYRIKYLT